MLDHNHSGRFNLFFYQWYLSFQTIRCKNKGNFITFFIRWIKDFSFFVENYQYYHRNLIVTFIIIEVQRNVCRGEWPLLVVGTGGEPRTTKTTTDGVFTLLRSVSYTGHAHRGIWLVDLTPAGGKKKKSERLTTTPSHHTAHLALSRRRVRSIWLYDIKLSPTSFIVIVRSVAMLIVSAHNLLPRV